MRHMMAQAIFQRWMPEETDVFNAALKRLYGHDRFAHYNEQQIAWIVYDDLPAGRTDGVRVMARNVSLETLEHRIKVHSGFRHPYGAKGTRPFSIADRTAEEWAHLALAVEARHRIGFLKTVPVDSLRRR